MSYRLNFFSLGSEHLVGVDCYNLLAVNMKKAVNSIITWLAPQAGRMKRIL